MKREVARTDLSEAKEIMDEYLSRSFDAGFEGLRPLLKYSPWVGRDYVNVNEELRTLVIAESVYNWGEEDYEEVEQLLKRRDFVRILIHQHGLQKSYEQYKPVERSKSPTFRNLEKALFGKGTVNEHESETLWLSVAFHEFVQSPMDSIKRRPSADDWKKGAELLKAVLRLLQPRVYVILGTDWRKVEPMREFSRKDERLFGKIGRACPRVLTTDIGGVPSKLLLIRHPSKYFSWERWHKEFLAKEMPEFIEHLKGS